MVWSAIPNSRRAPSAFSSFSALSTFAACVLIQFIEPAKSSESKWRKDSD
jgi:hypothetical protein